METSDLDPVSAVLGRLYLEQGHLSDAEAVFRAVLRRDAADRAARDGLEAVREARRRGVERPGAEASGDSGESGERLVRLRSFLERIEAARRHRRAD